MKENKKGKEELGKAAEEELMANLERWVNKWERDFEVTLVLGFMVMDSKNFEIVGSRMVIYPENYEKGKIHLNALQNYCDGLKENA
ncbi:MAG: hypothetical protein JSW12_00195 [Deltaproteobacteria bacterium]|nr:MAG: hypothetical protein JSW12_00195 [Deltaproteobacteria bacterium]